MENDRKTDIAETAVSDDIKKRFSEKVIDRWFNPRNMGVIDHPDGYGSAGTSCGDTVEIFLRVKDDIIKDIRFSVRGCSTTIAVGSIVTELAHGKNIKAGLKIDSAMIINGLDGLPEGNAHCADMARDALHRAISNYLSLKNEPWKKAYRKI